MEFPNPYESKRYKLLILIPAVLIVLALGLVFFKGISQGVDLKGGVLFTAITDESVDLVSLQGKVAEINPEGSVRIFNNPTGTGIEIELPNSESLTPVEAEVKQLQSMDAELLELELNASVLAAQNDETPSEALAGEVRELARRQTALNAEIISKASAVLKQMDSGANVPSDGHEAVRVVVQEYGKAQDNYRAKILSAVEEVATVKSHSFREVGPSLSRFFLDKSREILLYSFILAAIVVFIVFRAFIPSVVVVVGAVADIIITVGAMSLFDIPLTLASIAGLLMLIGFSLDTDVMLTMRILKRTEGTPAERAFDAFKTGAMMNLTTIGAFGVLALTGLYLQIPTYYQIGIVAVIGGIVDFAATWGINAVLVVQHMEKKIEKPAIG